MNKLLKSILCAIGGTAVLFSLAFGAAVARTYCPPEIGIGVCALLLVVFLTIMIYGRCFRD